MDFDKRIDYYVGEIERRKERVAQMRSHASELRQTIARPACQGNTQLALRDQIRRTIDEMVCEAERNEKLMEEFAIGIVAMEKLKSLLT